MTDEKETPMQETASRMLALFEEHKPDAAHNCPTCGREHTQTERAGTWYSFTHEAISEHGAHYEALSTLMQDDAPDMDAGYQWTVEVLDAIEDGSITDEDGISEWADSATPVYTWDLLQWIGQGTNRLELITDMLEEYGTLKESGSALLMAAYCYGLDRYARQVYQLVADHAEGDDETNA